MFKTVTFLISYVYTHDSLYVQIQIFHHTLRIRQYLYLLFLLPSYMPLFSTLQTVDNTILLKISHTFLL